jgi:hypothetical protein
LITASVSSSRPVWTSVTSTFLRHAFLPLREGCECCRGGRIADSAMIVGIFVFYWVYGRCPRFFFLDRGQAASAVLHGCGAGRSDHHQLHTLELLTPIQYQAHPPKRQPTPRFPFLKSLEPHSTLRLSAIDIHYGSVLPESPQEVQVCRLQNYSQQINTDNGDRLVFLGEQSGSYIPSIFPRV